MSVRTERDRILILILGALMAFGPLSIDLYLPSFPLIAANLSVSPVRVELSLASFFIGLALGQLLYGPLSDRLGRRPTVLWAWVSMPSLRWGAQLRSHWSS